MVRKPKARKELPLVYVFYEGESEKVYMHNFCREYFQKKAVIRVHHEKGLFLKALRTFDKNPKYRAEKEVINELWFFFDTEQDTPTEKGVTLLANR